jgi:chromosomal replication initiator protein
VPEDLETTWESVRLELRSEVTDFAFHVWIDPLRPRGRNGDTLFVDAPRHMRTLVGERYLAKLEAAARRALGAQARIELVGEGFPQPTELTGRGSASPAEERLNPKYTFDQFVIGEGNRLAHAASLAVAEMPAQAYNPLFIHGHPGLGKTHLLHAIGNYVLSHGAGLTVRFATVESFTGAFVEALRRRETAVFKERFRGTDVLLIDDVQFLADKTRTKEEFFHTFNALYESGRQLVLTSDRSPSDMSDFEARLTERFACGLVAELEPPSYEVRLAILRKRARHDQLRDVGDDTLAEIALHVRSSVRALEGALIRVVAYASLRAEPPSAELAAEVLARLYPRPSGGQPSVREVQEAAAAALGVELEALLARDRRPGVAFARQVAMYLARELTGGSYPAIGRSFGGRDHATVLHAHRKVADQIGSEGDTTRAVQAVTTRLREGR